MTEYQTVTDTDTQLRDGTIKLHGPAAFEAMRKAGRLAKWMASGGDVAFIIGGPDGLDPRIRQSAHETLRLSSLTLPHALVRVILAEALYRAASVIKGHPYHRA